MQIPKQSRISQSAQRFFRQIVRAQATGLILPLALAMSGVAFGQLTDNEKKAIVGDAPSDPGPLASDLSTSLRSKDIKAAMRKVADWQTDRIAQTPSQDWTFATLYVGLLAAADTLEEARYRRVVQRVAEHYDWTLGPRKTHADDQAIGQAYLALYRRDSEISHIAPTRAQLESLMQIPDNPAKPVWWWCDALFMAPPVWANLSATTHDPRFFTYLDHEWHVTSRTLWDTEEKLYYRDQAYLKKREKNGKKVFWSRGNGWVMGGLVRVLEAMPQDDPRRQFYVAQLQAMAGAVAKLQGADGLWRAGLLDAEDYPLPEISGSAFFVYALAWGIDRHVLDETIYLPVVRRGWAGMVRHIYQTGRIGCIQPVGEAPGAYSASASSVFGTGAFLLAGSQVERLAEHASSRRASHRHFQK